MVHQSRQRLRLFEGAAYQAGRASVGLSRMDRALPTPHDDPAAEAHQAHSDIFHPGALPGLNVPGGRVPPVVLGDGWAEETADLEPLPATSGPTGRRQHDAC